MLDADDLQQVFMESNGSQRQEEQILAIAKQFGVVRPRDVVAQGLSTAPITRLVRRGALVRSGRGLYELPDAELTESHTLVEAAARVPSGIVCLLSALRFHEIGTQTPHLVWMAIHPKARRPNVDHPAMQFVRFSGPAMTLGVETHLIEGRPVKVFSMAKTVVDCFRYRNKLGLDVALEALRDYLGKGGSPDELWQIAKACRIAGVVRPYIEASL